MSSEFPIRLRGGRVLDPSSGLDRIADLSLSEGIIRGLDLPAVAGERVIDVSGCWVVPGLVDIHTHLREPGQTHKETIRSGTRAAAAGGFTTVCAMANTDPVIDAPDRVAWVRREVAASAVIRVVTIAAVTAGLRGRELTAHAALVGAGARAFSDDGHPLLDPELFERALRSMASLGTTISVHAEDTSRGDPGFDRRIAPDIGCVGIEAAAEYELIDAHLAVLARVPGARLHIAHLTTAEGVASVRAAKRAGLSVTAEVTPHHLTLTYETVARPRFGLPGDPLGKVNPPLRSEDDRRALLEGLSDGTIDAVATDHAPHTLEEKAVALDGAPSGLTGLELAVPAVVALVAAGRLELSRAIDALTAAACRSFGLPYGGLRPGSVADVAVIDPDLHWPVTPATLRSGGVNTPHLGETLQGGVRLTLYRGRLVHVAGDDDGDPPCS